LWRQAAQPEVWPAEGLGKGGRERSNALHAVAALTLGRPGLFRARYPGLWSILPWMPKDRALLDHRPLADTLERLVDFDRLNGGEIRFALIAVDLETGEEVWFDNREHRIGPEHLLATSALAPLFPPVEIGGRLLTDPGYVNNLPIDRLFAQPLAGDLLAFAVELCSLRHGRPHGLDAVVNRTQDILFASHARRSVDFLRREQALRRQLDPKSPSATFVHLAYRAPEYEIAAKALDFSRASISDRMATGQLDMERALALLAEQTPTREPFLHLHLHLHFGSASENAHAFPKRHERAGSAPVLA
jgi:NTE family protein